MNWRKWKRRLEIRSRSRNRPIRPKTPGRILMPEVVQPPVQLVRFSRLNRVLHVFMILSFMNLALTELSLTFSYTLWASKLSRLLGGFETAGFIHRTAAVIMFAVFCTHLIDLARRKNRECGSWRNLLFGPNTMLFTRKDIRDFLGNIK